MNLEKFTDRAKGFLQSAQTVAIRMNHQRIAPEHLLKALLEDEQGMAAGLIRAAGGEPKRRGERDRSRRWPRSRRCRASGAQTPPGLDNDAVRVLDQAEQIAAKAGDSYRHRRAAAGRAGAGAQHRGGQGAARRRASTPEGAQRRDQRSCAAGAPPTPRAPRTATTRSRNSRATSPRRRATASSIR